MHSLNGSDGLPQELDGRAVCAVCDLPLNPDSLVCAYCESARAPAAPEPPHDALVIRRLVRRAWGILLFGLVVFQPILQPATCVFALSTLRRAAFLSPRMLSLEIQLALIAAISAVLSIISWAIVLHLFGVF